MLSRICEEFHIPPSQAVDEPLEVCLLIMESRAYAKAKQIVEQTEKAEDLPDDPMVDLVQEIQFALAREAIEARRARK